MLRRRKGQGGWVVGILILLVILAIVGWAWQNKETVLTSPDQIVEFYGNIFNDPRVKENPAVLILTLIVPFLSSFAITWALTSMITAFRSHYGAGTEKAAAIFALGVSLYAMPTMSMMLMYAFPYFVMVGSVGVLAAIAIFGAKAGYLELQGIGPTPSFTWRRGGGTPMAVTPTAPAHMPPPTPPTAPGAAWACPGCGNQNTPDANYCRRCGRPRVTNIQQIRQQLNQLSAGFQLFVNTMNQHINNIRNAFGGP